MEKVKYIIIILILIFIILSFCKSKNNIFNDVMIFSLWGGTQNEYVLNPQSEEVVQIDVFNTIYNGKKLHKKISPGSYGKFTIKLKKPIDSNSTIILTDITNKPQNLIFELENRKYYTLKQMQQDINTIFQSKNSITINWKWKYDNSSEDDIQDTIDGQNAHRYIFKIQAIIEREI